MDDITLPDGEPEVLVAGDWHSNGPWVNHILRRAHECRPGARTVLQLGDLNVGEGRVAKGFLNTLDKVCAETGVERVLSTPGNHDHWGRLLTRFEKNPGKPVQLSDSLWVLPRGYRFTLNGIRFLSFGGAASVDVHSRTLTGPGRDWWEEEVPTNEECVAAALGDPVDVILVHEGTNYAGPKMQGILNSNPYGFPADALRYSAVSRDRITRVFDELRPRLLMHGHLHVNEQQTLEDGRVVRSMGCDKQPGNMGHLGLNKRLNWQWVS